MPDIFPTDVLYALLDTRYSGGKGFATKALMLADLNYSDGVTVTVTNDPTPANNGEYRKSGAVGAGSWVQSSFDRVAALETKESATATGAKLPNIFPKGNLANSASGMTWGTVVDGFTAPTIAATADSVFTSRGITTVAQQASNTNLAAEMPLDGAIAAGLYYYAECIVYAPTGVEFPDDILLTVDTKLATNTTVSGTTATKAYAVIDANHRRYYTVGRFTTDSSFTRILLRTRGAVAGTVSVSGYVLCVSRTSINATTNIVPANDWTGYRTAGEYLYKTVEKAVTDIAANTANVAAAVLSTAQKAGKIYPLKPASLTNAITDRFGETSQLSAKHALTPNYASTMTYAFNQILFDNYAEPNAIALTCVAALAAATTKPRGVLWVSKDDLAAIGVIPDDTTPPTISTMGVALKGSAVNQTVNSAQIWICLRYGATKSSAYSATNDVIMINNSANPTTTGLGNNDTIWNNGAHTVGIIDDANQHGFWHQGIKIPATYGGQAFSGIIIAVFGSVTANNSTPGYIEFARLAVVAGSSIDTTKTYLNDSDEFIKTGVHRIDIKSSDRIGFIGDSYTESSYSIPGKAYINKLSQFSDYCFENFAVSGHTYRDRLAAIRGNTPKYHTTLSWVDYNVKYAILISYTNDLKYSTLSEYMDDLRATCETVKSLGAIPIVSTEYHESFGAGISAQLKMFCDRSGYLFMNLLPKARLFNTSYAPFWVTSHPGTRANELFSESIEPFLKSLPAPRQSIKLFRKRGTVSVSTVDDLLFDTKLQRAKLFREIYVGHTGLSAASEKYFDALDQSNGTTLVTSEYLKLQNGDAVAFTDYALIDVVLPATVRDITALALCLGDTSMTVYARDSMVAPYEAATLYQRFNYSGDPTVVAGDTYTTTAYSAQTFTVISKEAGFILMSPNKANVDVGSGTLTRASGTGDASITFTSATDGFTPEWYANQGKPEGHWSQITASAGKFSLTSLNGKIQGDKVSFLLYKSAGFSLTGCYVEWIGTESKPFYPVMPFKIIEPKGAELLTQPLIGTSGQLAAWTTTGTAVTTGTPADSVLPTGTTGKVTVTTATKLSQSFTVAADALQDREIQIKIWCRVFPTIFNPAGSYPSTSPITQETYDYGTIGVDLITGAVVSESEDKVGLHWKEIIIVGLVPAGITAQSVRVYPKDKDIEIAKVSVRLMES